MPEYRTADEAQAAATKALLGRLIKVTSDLTGLDKTRPYLLRVTRVDVVSATSGLVHVYGNKFRLDGAPSREKNPTKAASFMPGWEGRVQFADQEA